jgi:WD40 repeat protein
MSQLIPSTTPIRDFKGHGGTVKAVAVFPDRRRMITGSDDKTLRLWDLETGVMLKKMEGHRDEVWALGVSRDGQIIASGDFGGEIIAWHGENGESLTKPIKAHFNGINSVDFSPDGTVLATGSYDGMTKFWCTKTWRMQGEPIECGDHVNCVQYSPSGELLAIATVGNIQIYNSGTKKRVASFWGHTTSLAWTLPVDGTRLLSGGNNVDPTIREWDPLTWQQVGAFDITSVFTNQDSKTSHFLLLIKVNQICLTYSLLHFAFQAIALFNADQHEEAMLLVKELAAACPNADILGCRVVEVSVLR